MEKLNSEKSRSLFLETKKYLVDGASSSFHKAATEEYPVCADYGQGSKLYDVDGNEYIDYVLGFGPMILGYSPDVVNQAVLKQVVKGSQFSTPTYSLCKLAKRLTEIIPCAEKVSFQNTGTEANMHAFRVVRACTGKDKIVKFEGQYHGWSDEQKITISADSINQLGPKNKPWQLLGSAGQNQSSGQNMIIMPWNDIDILRDLFERRGHEIAAVITEPYMCNQGPIMPKKGYLEELRELTRKYDILLIFDEVITGFRLGLGGAQEYFGVTPDVSVFGKAMTAGYSLSAICGKKEIMDCGVHPSGTFNANPIAVAATLATISALEEDGVYERFQYLGDMLAEGIRELGRKHNIKLYATANRSICQLQLGIDRPVESYRDHLENSDSKMYNRLFLESTKYGVRISSGRGRLYLSTAHTEEDIEKTLKVFDKIFSEF